MAWSAMMSKQKPVPSEKQRELRSSERRSRGRAAGDFVADVGGQSFRRFGFVQSAVVSRWAEIVGERYASVSCPESIRFPAGRKSGGVLTLLVEGAHSPLIQHLTPLIVERVNRFFGYEAINRIVFRQGRLPAVTAKPKRAALAPVPREIGDGLREIADPELRACLESLAGRIAATSGMPEVPPGGAIDIPVIKRSK